MNHRWLQRIAKLVLERLVRRGVQPTDRRELDPQDGCVLGAHKQRAQQGARGYRQRVRVNEWL
jgi:hypothetical protein